MNVSREERMEIDEVPVAMKEIIVLEENVLPVPKS